MDEYNVFVSGSRFGRERWPRGVHSEGIDAAVEGRNGSGMYLNYESVPVVGVYHWIDEVRLALLVELSQGEAFEPARRIAWLILAIGVLLAAGLTAGTVLLARQIARPVLAIAETAQRVTDGDLRAAAPVLTEDELGVLARTFNQMTKRLSGLYDDLKQEIAERRQAQEEREEFVRELQARKTEPSTSPTRCLTFCFTLPRPQAGSGQVRPEREQGSVA